MSDDNLCWVDLETTGSNVDHDEIIEIGAILTTPTLEQIGDPFQQVLEPGPMALGRMMQNAVVREMHKANGLLADVLNDQGVRPHVAATRMLEWLDRYDHGDFRRGRNLILAGSGVGHFDKRFIDKYLPQVSQRLRYYVLDIGVIRRAHRMWLGSDLSTANDGKTHRALDDIKCHLDEARDFQRLWTAGQ